MGSTPEWNPNPPWREMDANSASQWGTLNVPASKKLLKTALRGVKDEIQQHTCGRVQAPRGDGVFVSLIEGSCRKDHDNDKEKLLQENLQLMREKQFWSD